MISAKEYPRLKQGDVLVFSCRTGDETGRLLYAETRKHFLCDDKGNQTDEFLIVPHRVGYEPLEPQTLFVRGEQLKVHSVHLEAGMFKVSRPV
jgi:hypothetical protein